MILLYKKKTLAKIKKTAVFLIFAVAYVAAILVIEPRHNTKVLAPLANLARIEAADTFHIGDYVSPENKEASDYNTGRSQLFYLLGLTTVISSLILIPGVKRD